jgi:hypothetical protein
MQHTSGLNLKYLPQTMHMCVRMWVITQGLIVRSGRLAAEAEDAPVSIGRILEGFANVGVPDPDHKHLKLLLDEVVSELVGVLGYHG